MNKLSCIEMAAECLWSESKDFSE